MFRKQINIVKVYRNLLWRAGMLCLLLSCAAADLYSADWVVNKATISWQSGSSIVWSAYSNVVKTEIISEQVDTGTTTSVNVTAEGGTIQLQDSKIIIPPGALEKDTVITMENIAVANAPPGDGAAKSVTPVAFFRFSPDGLRFKKGCEVVLAYDESDSDGKVDNTNISETLLKVFWWDEFHWRLIGGTVDAENNTVSVKISHFSDYALFPTGAATADDYRPKKTIITPYSEYKHCDRAYFTNLDNNQYKINIFDITGRNIRVIDGYFYDNNGGYWWDGKDDDDEIVESGVYIYQFEVDGEMISGTIAVAK